MSYAEVEPDEVEAHLAHGEDVFLLDVREPDEVAAWSYPDRRQHPARAARRPPGRAAAGRHHRRGLPPRRPVGHRGPGTERGGVDGREPHRRRRRLGGGRNQRLGPGSELVGDPGQGRVNTQGLRNPETDAPDSRPRRQRCTPELTTEIPPCSMRPPESHQPPLRPRLFPGPRQLHRRGIPGRPG